jgi:hypothetical protein
MEAGRLGSGAPARRDRSGVRLRAERRMAPTGSRTTAARMAAGRRGSVRDPLRASGWCARALPAADTNLVPRRVTRMELLPRCMCRWYRLSVFEQAAQRQRLCLADGAAPDGQVELA